MERDEKEEEAINSFNHSFHSIRVPPLYKLGISFRKIVNTPCPCEDSILVRGQMKKEQINKMYCMLNNKC